MLVECHKAVGIICVFIYDNVSKGGCQKKGFHPGPIMWVSYSGLWVAGPNNFSCCVGWVLLPSQQASGSTFSPKSHSF